MKIKISGIMIFMELNSFFYNDPKSDENKQSIDKWNKK